MRSHANDPSTGCNFRTLQGIKKNKYLNVLTFVITNVIINLTDTTPNSQSDLGTLNMTSSNVSVNDYSDDYSFGALDYYDTILKLSPVICLCGSLKYWDTMIQANAMLVTKNIISIPSGFSMKYPEIFPVVAGYVAENPEKMKRIFDELHFQKILTSHGIWVLNVDDYIGDSTKREILFAQATGKEIFTIEPCSFLDESHIPYNIVRLDVSDNFPESFYNRGTTVSGRNAEIYFDKISNIDGK